MVSLVTLLAACDQEPKAPPPAVEVTVAWPGAAAEAVDAQIGKPLEARLLALPGATKTRALSTRGQAWVRVDFARPEDPSKVDPAAPVQTVSKAANEVLANLPTYAEAPVVRGTPGEGIVVAITSDNPTIDLDATAALYADALKAAKDVRGVRVDPIRGTDRRWILDAALIKKAGVTPAGVLKDIQACRAGGTALDACPITGTKKDGTTLAAVATFDPVPVAPPIAFELDDKPVARVTVYGDLGRKKLEKLALDTSTPTPGGAQWRVLPAPDIAIDLGRGTDVEAAYTRFEQLAVARGANAWTETGNPRTLTGHKLGLLLPVGTDAGPLLDEVRTTLPGVPLLAYAPRTPCFDVAVSGEPWGSAVATARTIRDSTSAVTGVSSAFVDAWSQGLVWAATMDEEAATKHGAVADDVATTLRLATEGVDLGDIVVWLGDGTADGRELGRHEVPGTKAPIAIEKVAALESTEVLGPMRRSDGVATVTVTACMEPKAIPAIVEQRVVQLLGTVRYPAGITAKIVEE